MKVDKREMKEVHKNIYQLSNYTDNKMKKQPNKTVNLHYLRSLSQQADFVDNLMHNVHHPHP